MLGRVEIRIQIKTFISMKIGTKQKNVKKSEGIFALIIGRKIISKL